MSKKCSAVIVSFLLMSGVFAEASVRNYRCSGHDRYAGRVKFSYAIGSKGSTLIFSSVQNPQPGPRGLKAGLEIRSDWRGAVTIGGVVGSNCTLADELMIAGEGSDFTLYYWFSCGKSGQLDVKAHCNF